MFTLVKFILIRKVSEERFESVWENLDSYEYISIGDWSLSSIARDYLHPDFELVFTLRSSYTIQETQAWRLLRFG